MNNFFLSNLWRWKCGLPEFNYRNTSRFHNSINFEFSDNFLILMKNRIKQGYYRYGSLYQSCYSFEFYLRHIRRNLKLYKSTGNSEYLVDSANFLMILYVNNVHPNSHFLSTDDKNHL